MRLYHIYLIYKDGEQATIILMQEKRRPRMIIPFMNFFLQPGVKKLVGFLGSKAIWHYSKRGQNLMLVLPFLLYKTVQCINVDA